MSGDISIYQVCLLSPLFSTLPFLYTFSSFSSMLLSLHLSFLIPLFLLIFILTFPPLFFYLVSFLISLIVYSLSSPFFSAHVVCMTPRGLRFATLSNSWTYSCSLVRHLCFVTGHLLEMSWLVSRDLWSSSWFECRGYVSKVTLCVPG